MSAPSSALYLFGDLLALARLNWIETMAARLEELGHAGYRRSDAVVLRVVSRRSLAVGELGAVVGVTRQAARKLVGALEQRGYARLERDPDDSRRRTVVLTPAGDVYAAAVVATLEAMSRELAERVDHSALSAADAVMRASLNGDRARRRADALVAPPAPGPPGHHPGPERS
ncbi:MAG TPA: MarR family transcriptional regulator [Solirubrobacteraceae bacterium]